MNTTKKINVNFSSLVGLKAELLRKQTEVYAAKQRTETVHVAPKLKKKNKKLKEDNKNDNLKHLTDTDDINAHKKSKLMLQAKSRLYDRMKRAKNNNDNFLVDFTNKSDESEEEPLKEEEDEYDEIIDNEDDWVEYEDCFGRTRKCLREDLHLMQGKDELIKQQIMNRKNDDTIQKDTIAQSCVVEEKEPEIEIMRRKWEEQTQKLTDKANIHYQDVLFDEARAHGVGYYAFSQDEEERAKQQENLVNLRKETERKQNEMKELKELREKMEQNRLKAARIRQRIRAGLPAEPTEEEIMQDSNAPTNVNVPENKSDETNVDNTLVTNTNKEVDILKENNEEDAEVVKENKIQALGELLGKRSHWYELSQEEWVHKCRKMRVGEFAPTYQNFRSVGYLNNEDNITQSIVNEECRSKETEFPDSIQNDLMKQEDNDISIDSSKHNENVTNKEDTNQSSFHQTVLSELARNQDSSTENNLFRSEQADIQTNVSSTTQFGSDLTSKNVQDNEQIHPYQSIHTSSTFSNNTIDNHTKPVKSIDENSIAAGLKYLREKFEKSQNT